MGLNWNFQSGGGFKPKNLLGGGGGGRGLVGYFLEQHISRGVLRNQLDSNVQFQKISIPTPWKVNGNSKGVGGLKSQNFKRPVWGLTGNSRGVGGFKPKNLPWEGYGYFLEQHISHGVPRNQLHSNVLPSLQGKTLCCNNVPIIRIYRRYVLHRESQF